MQALATSTSAQTPLKHDVVESVMTRGALSLDSKVVMKVNFLVGHGISITCLPYHPTKPYLCPSPVPISAVAWFRVLIQNFPLGPRPSVVAGENKSLEELSLGKASDSAGAVGHPTMRMTCLAKQGLDKM